MARPMNLKPNASGNVHFAITMSQETMTKLQAVAREQDRTVPQMAARLVRLALAAGLE